MDTVFHKIIRGEIPATKEFEDDDCIVIKDIHPKAPVHLLVIPKKDMPSISYMSHEDQLLIGKLMKVATEMAEKFNTKDAFRLVINNGSGAGQEVFQLHIHVLGGYKTRPGADTDL
jgi:histidine triad (HIT) family protein